MSGRSPAVEVLTIRQARRLALARAGLLRPELTGMPCRASGRGRRARRAAHEVIRRFGYLQLDTVAVAGARTHVIVLLSRLGGFDPALGEELLQPKEPLFEYWGHEASWMPIALYPAFEFRRREFQTHPWWGDLIGQHPEVADGLRRRIREEGPLRSADMEGASKQGWWDLGVVKRVALSLWSNGEFAIRERKSFQRTYDLAERVIPRELLDGPLDRAESLEILLLRALEGHGWATTTTLASTWRLRNCRDELESTLARLEEAGTVVRAGLENSGGRLVAGWIRREDLELADRLDRARPNRERGVLLSPFDPLLWDRGRVEQLFGFDQVLEIYKPAAKRRYGYYCMPVLAGERLVARVDLRAERSDGFLRVLSRRYEGGDPRRPERPGDEEATRVALERYAASLELELRSPMHRARRPRV